MELINNINKTLRDDLASEIKAGSRLSIAAACFSIYAFQELKSELQGIDELRFIFTSPTFTTEKAKKEKREFYIPRLNRERSLYGTEFEIKLRNELTQKSIAKECADWIRQKVTFKSNVTNENMLGFINLDDKNYMPVNGFTTVDLGCERGNYAYGRQLLSKAKEEVTSIMDATSGYRLHDRQKVIAVNQKSPIRHAYYREFRNLQYLCLLILRHQKNQIGTGSKELYGILFDGAWLWEEYINLLVDDAFYHPRNKASQGAQRLFAGNAGLIYPDFISKDSQYRVIGDAKYKPVANIGNKDYLQVLAYMFRFDAKKGFYFYPSTSGTQEQCLWVNEGLTYEKNVRAREDICVIKLGIHVPGSVEPYEKFVSDMKAAENIFKQTIKMRMKM